MIKNNVRIKDFTLSDQVLAIEMIADSYFTNGRYTPYYAERASIYAIVDNFIEGVTFDKEEDVFECVLNDEELHELVDKFFIPHTVGLDENGNRVITERNPYFDAMDFVNHAVIDMVTFEKEKRIHNSDQIAKFGEFIDILFDAIEEFSKASFSKLSPKELKDVVSFAQKFANSNVTEKTLRDALKETSYFNTNDAMSEIIDSKNKEIEELKNRVTMYDAKNVLADS